MQTFNSALTQRTALSESDILRLSELVAEWQLLADLSFADLILWVPRRKDYKSWPEGHVAIAHIRPTTAATVFSHNVIGNEILWGSKPRIDQALSNGEIIRDTEPEKVGEILVKEETVPVFFEGNFIAVISRYRNVETMRTTSKLELISREIAHKIYKMVSEGNFPIKESVYLAESAPRVGDGLIRLDVNGVVIFASPNARSALNKVGWPSDLEGHNLGDVLDSLQTGSARYIPREENWHVAMSGKALRREEFDCETGTIDLLSIPLTQANDRIGAIVLAHNVTELRRRDRALLSKDATIREIHHRVKNNLQTVSALLRLQSRRIDDPNASAALEEAVRRVASIAIVHETLSTSDQETVAFDEVMDRIMANAVELSTRTNEISIERTGNFGGFPAIVATPLALVLTELIHNALEHGLGSVGSKLELRVERTETLCRVHVMDNGSGLAEGFKPEQEANLGLQIVQTLTVNELNGSIEFKRLTEGTEAVVTFPIRN